MPDRTETARFVSDSTHFTDNFGSALATDGQTLIVGHPNHISLRFGREERDGAVSFYDRDPGSPTGWRLQALHRPPPSALTQVQSVDFGIATDVDDDLAVIADDRAGIVGTRLPPGQFLVSNAGAVHVYARDAITGLWAPDTALVASGFIDNGGFGTAVALSGTTLAVATPRVVADSSATYLSVIGRVDYRRGVIYVFDRGEDGRWTQTARLISTGEPNGDAFGHNVALATTPDGRAVLAAGAYSLDRGEEAHNSGHAFVYERTPDGTWTDPAVLLLPVPVEAAWFGRSTGVSGTGPDAVVLIGADGEDAEATYSGSIHAFVRCEASTADCTGGWAREAVLAPPEQASVGELMDVTRTPSGALAVVTTGQDANRNGLGLSGAAYVFRRDPSDGSWHLTTRLGPSDASIVRRFSSAVGITPDGMVIGSNGRNRTQPDGTVTGGTVFTFDVSDVVVSSERPLDSSALELAVWPNPVRQFARITYALVTPGTVRLSVHDALGREVAVLRDTRQLDGEHTAEWRPDGLAAGVYLVRLATEAGVRTRTLIVAR